MMSQSMVLRIVYLIVLITFFGLIAVTDSQAQIMCGYDLNGDGDFDAEGETAECLGTAPDYICPLGETIVCETPTITETVKVATCPIDPTIPCDSNDECQQVSYTCLDGIGSGVLEIDEDTVFCTEPDFEIVVAACDIAFEEQTGPEQVVSCGEETSREFCDPDTRTATCPLGSNLPCNGADQCSRTGQVCDYQQVCDEIEVCDPDTVRTVCEDGGTERQCSIERQCDEDSVQTICDPETKETVCDPPTLVWVPPVIETQCQPDTVTYSCPIPGYPCMQSGPGYFCFPLAPCVCPGDDVICELPDGGTCIGGIETVRLECLGTPVPGACNDVVIEPGYWREEPGQCREVVTPGACREEIVPGQCRDVEVCRDVTIEGDCREEIVPGSCRFEPDPSTCRQEVVPGSCRNVTESAQCNVTVTPGECVTQTIPAECSSEDAAVQCPADPDVPCVSDASGGTGSVCNVNTCVDLAVQTPEITTIDNGVYENDGETTADGECLDEMMIYPGRPLDCRPSGLVTAFQNCCRDTPDAIVDDFNNVSGRPPSHQDFILFELIGLGCDQTDINTSVLRTSDMCVFVGSYCRERWPLIGCVQKAHSHCCFNSKMARIIHEQGRAQIASFDGDFGTAEEPNCRGFTPDEFQAIDFSKIDLSEYYGDIATEAMAVIEVQVGQGVTKAVSEKTGGY